MSKNKFMTTDEEAMLTKLGDIYNDFCYITGYQETRMDDLSEVAFHIHALQNMILAQAGARVTNKARLMGEVMPLHSGCGRC